MLTCLRICHAWLLDVLFWPIAVAYESGFISLQHALIASSSAHLILCSICFEIVNLKSPTNKYFGWQSMERRDLNIAVRHGRVRVKIRERIRAWGRWRIWNRFFYHLYTLRWVTCSSDKLQNSTILPQKILICCNRPCLVHGPTTFIVHFIDCAFMVQLVMCSHRNFWSWKARKITIWKWLWM